MTPGKYNMICPQGATFSKTLTWTINDVAVDLSGYTARMQARDKIGGSCIVVNITTENSGITLDSQGNINLLISSADTSIINAKDYVYDLELDSGSEVYRVIEGKFIVTPEVTK